MSQPLISCIVPVFNGELYLCEALESILGQTYRPLEVIVADDGSTDRTADVVASYGRRIKYLFQPNAGAAAARNLGLASAQGEFVAFLDADDLWHEQKLARQMACFGARPELHICVTLVQNFWIPELSEEAERFETHPRAQPLPGYQMSALLAKRSLFEGVGRFDVALTHTDDTEWFLRATELGALSELLPDVLVHRRLHHANVSRRHASASRDEYLRLLKTLLERRRTDNTDARNDPWRKSAAR